MYINKIKGCDIADWLSRVSAHVELQSTVKLFPKSFNQMYISSLWCIFVSECYCVWDSVFIAGSVRFVINSNEAFHFMVVQSILSILYNTMIYFHSRKDATTVFNGNAPNTFVGKVKLGTWTFSLECRWILFGSRDWLVDLGFLSGTIKMIKL